MASVVGGLSPNSICSIITPSLKQGKKIYWKKRTLQNFPPRSWVAKEQNDDLTLYLHNGSYIEVDGSENIDAHRGDRKDLVILDEYKDIDPRFYAEVVEPMFLTTGGIVMIIGTPPETPESHFRDMDRHSQEDPTWANIHWTSYDSPYTDHAWLDAKRIELEKRGELDVFNREYLAEYTRGGKNSVFPMFSRELHVKSRATVHRYYHSIKDRCELYWVNDPATSSTFGAILVAYCREKGQIIFLDEIYAQDKSKTHTSAIVDEARAKMAQFEPEIKEWHIAHDDAAVWFANEMLYQHGLNSYPANKSAVEKEEGIALFKSLLLSKNSVIMSESCENLATELENYIMLNGKYPLINDHLIDATRYFLIAAKVILSLAENSDLLEDNEDLFDFGLEHLYNDNGLPGFIQ